VTVGRFDGRTSVGRDQRQHASTGFSVTIMTRSGAPFQGATGVGNAMTSADVAQPPEAAAAGDGAVAINKGRNPCVISKHVVAAEAKRRARSISTSPC